MLKVVTFRRDSAQLESGDRACGVAPIVGRSAPDPDEAGGAIEPKGRLIVLGDVEKDGETGAVRRREQLGEECPGDALAPRRRPDAKGEYLAFLRERDREEKPARRPGRRRKGQRAERPRDRQDLGDRLRSPGIFRKTFAVERREHVLVGSGDRAQCAHRGARRGPGMAASGARK